MNPADIARALSEFWQPIETAPKDGSEFLGINHDGEIWLCRCHNGRLNYRTNKLYAPRRFEIVEVNGERLLREDEEYARTHERWTSDWTVWARGYEFNLTHWFPFSRPTASDASTDRTPATVDGCGRKVEL